MVRVAYDRQEGRWLKSALSHILSTPEPFSQHTATLKCLLGLLISSGHDQFRSKLLSAIGEAFASHVTGLLERAQASKSAPELQRNLKQILGALARMQLPGDDLCTHLLLKEVHTSCRWAWRGLSRTQTAELAELLCLAANRVRPCAHDRIDRLGWAVYIARCSATAPQDDIRGPGCYSICVSNRPPRMPGL